MHRTTVGGKKKPSKDTRDGEVPLQYHCHNYPPFDAGQYCLFTLSDAVFYPRYGEFETVEDQRQRCRNVHKNADLAVIPTEEWNKVIMICASKVYLIFFAGSSKDCVLDWCSSLHQCYQSQRKRYCLEHSSSS